MAFTPGKTGNPNGRPRKGNTLTDILDKAFDEARELYPGEAPLNTKRLIAEYVRGAITKGEVELVTGDILRFSPESWLDLVKWAFNRLDGNPMQPIEGSQSTVLHFDAIPTVEGDYVLTEEPIDVTNELV